MSILLQAQSGAEKAVSNGILSSPADSATISADLTAGSQVFKWTSTQNTTVNASGTQFAGQIVSFVILNDGGAGHVITFGTGFKSTGTLTLTTSQTRTVTFISDGTTLFEISRVASMA